MWTTFINKNIWLTLSVKYTAWLLGTDMDTDTDINKDINLDLDLERYHEE